MMNGLCKGLWLLARPARHVSVLQVQTKSKINLSNFINSKIKELREGLQTYPTARITINGQIYSRQKKSFYRIYHDLVCRECFSLN